MLHTALRRFRSTARRSAVAGAALACTVTLGAVVGAAPSDADLGTHHTASEDPLSGFTLQLGPEERVYGPTGKVDFTYFSERTTSGKLVGYISNNDSYRAASRRNAKLLRPRLTLKRGGIGKFDKCGAWLIGSVYKNPQNPRHWIAAYHAEAAGRGDANRCIFHDDSIVASVGLAVSRDGGTTWRKPNYPHNRIITQNSALRGAIAEDATDGRLLQMGNYLYLFYSATAPGDNRARKLHVARSHISEMGGPGSWFKYYCEPATLLRPRLCAFQDGKGDQEGYPVQRGLGGKSTPIQGIDRKARVIMPNTYLNHHLGFIASGKDGFRLYVSNSADTQLPMSWSGSIPIYPAVSHAKDRLVDQWGVRTARSKQLYAYPSIVGATGSSSTSEQVFYVYYVKIFPGGDFPDRYLMRRKLTLSKSSTGPYRVALTTYKSPSGHRRTSTERPQSPAYRAESTAVYLAGHHNRAADGYTAVFECRKGKDHILRLTSCRASEQPVRRVGWISPEQTTDATIPVYRCFNRAKRYHFASTDPGCLGMRKEIMLGYGLPAVSIG